MFVMVHNAYFGYHNVFIAQPCLYNIREKKAVYPSVTCYAPAPTIYPAVLLFIQPTLTWASISTDRKVVCHLQVLSFSSRLLSKFIF